MASRVSTAHIATGGGQYWAMDLAHDQLATGRRFRVLTVIDKRHRQCVALHADFSLTGQGIVDAMNDIALGRELPCAITVDHGTEFTSKALDEARLRLQTWRQDYNHHGPHGSLGRLTPSEFAAPGQKSDPEIPELQFQLL